jgi:nucleotide-binding universal stress UspA family protein
MIKSILVPTDGSDYSKVALQYAIPVAQAYQAKVMLLSVIDIRQLEGPFIQEMAVAGDPALGVHVAAVNSWLERRGKSYLDTLVTECGKAGLACESKLTTGIVSQEIIEQSKSCDLVVMGRHGEHFSWRGPLLGSTEESVVHGAIRPVLATPGEFHPFTRILMAYDGSRYASEALTVAADIAKGLQLPVVLLAVDHDIAWARERISEARRYLEPYRLDVQEEAIIGEPAEEILKAREKNNCDLIVMGAYGHSPLREFILGSITARVMRRAPCPVLIYR